MTDHDYQKLHQRVEQLERSNRRLRLVAWLLPTCLLLMGAGLAGEALAPDQLKVRKLTIVDQQGRDAFILGTDLGADATRSMIVMDPNGQIRLGFGVKTDQQSYLNIFDRKGHWLHSLGEERITGR